jgi:hypothetical protein
VGTAPLPCMKTQRRGAPFAVRAFTTSAGLITVVVHSLDAGLTLRRVEREFVRVEFVIEESGC